MSTGGSGKKKDRRRSAKDGARGPKKAVPGGAAARAAKGRRGGSKPAKKEVEATRPRDKAKPERRADVAVPAAPRQPAPPAPARIDAPRASEPPDPVTERRTNPRTLPASAPSSPPEMPEPPTRPFSRVPDPPERRPSEPPRAPTESGRLRALEDRLTALTRVDRRDTDAPPQSIREQVSSAAQNVVDRLAAPVSRVDETNVVDAVRDLLSSDYYLRKWGRLGMRNRSEEVDDFGLDPVYEARVAKVADFLYERYFRVEVEGVEAIPAAGPCLVVANHSGALPFDGLMLRTSVRRTHPAARDLRWLAEDFVYYLPFVGAFMSRVGAVRACQENAERLLAKDSLVAVFPEGVKGIGKLYRDRYKLQRFGRGGFIRLCLRTGTPLVPAAVIGAEEASPLLHRDELLSKLFGLPYLPVTPTFPLLGPLGLLPAPTKWRIRFGEIVRFDEYGPDAADDPVLVGKLADRVRASIQQSLDGGVASRKSVWFG